MCSVLCTGACSVKQVRACCNHTCAGCWSRRCGIPNVLAAPNGQVVSSLEEQSSNVKTVCTQSVSNQLRQSAVQRVSTASASVSLAYLGMTYTAQASHVCICRAPALQGPPLCDTHTMCTVFTTKRSVTRVISQLS